MKKLNYFRLFMDDRCKNLLRKGAFDSSGK